MGKQTNTSDATPATDSEASPQSKGMTAAEANEARPHRNPPQPSGGRGLPAKCYAECVVIESRSEHSPGVVLVQHTCQECGRGEAVRKEVQKQPTSPTPA